jgi:hypothetical protein
MLKHNLRTSVVLYGSDYQIIGRMEKPDNFKFNRS